MSILRKVGTILFRSYFNFKKPFELTSKLRPLNIQTPKHSTTISLCLIKLSTFVLIRELSGISMQQSFQEQNVHATGSTVTRLYRDRLSFSN